MTIQRDVVRPWHPSLSVVMRLIDRNDTSLAAALIVGAVVLFHQPLKSVFDIAGEIERRHHVDLIQTLVILAVAFGFHQYGKRRDANAAALAAAAEAMQARVRSQELEQLVGISRALATVTDFRGLSQALTRYLPAFASARDTWVLVYQLGCWDVLLRDATDSLTSEALESLAERALRCDAVPAGTDGGLRIDDLLAVPLISGARAVGVLLVRDSPPLSLDECRGLAAAGALTAIAIRNVQTLIETRDRSLRDGLTGCFNRAHALNSLTIELRRARRHRRPLSVLMFDVDGFKRVNDTYGHLTGDQLLAEIGQRLDAVVRTTDIKCRYGGDEFLVILPDTPGLGARQLAEALREAMSRVAIRTQTGALVSIAVSVGVATIASGDRDAVSVIARADRALYAAKERGRNCVCVDEPGPSSPLSLVSVNG